MKLIYLSDIEKLYCVKGIRVWFERHKLNFDHFVKHGISYSKLAKFRNCGFCEKLLTQVDNDGK